jgi:hypothetical protein
MESDEDGTLVRLSRKFTGRLETLGRDAGFAVRIGPLRALTGANWPTTPVEIAGKSYDEASPVVKMKGWLRRAAGSPYELAAEYRDRVQREGIPL